MVDTRDATRTIPGHLNGVAQAEVRDAREEIEARRSVIRVLFSQLKDCMGPAAAIDKLAETYSAADVVAALNV